MSIAELISLVAPPLCYGCGAASRAGPLCAGCRSTLRFLTPELQDAAGVAAFAPLVHADAARALVHALKYRGAAGLADTMAAQIVAGAPPGLLRERALVPVPLGRARRRARGFNQAERLAAAIARRTGLPRASCLERRDAAAAQVGRGRAGRLAGPSGAFAVGGAAPVPARVLLVDDVVTTGATVAACAEALLQAGAREVVAVAYARTPAR